MVGAGPAESFRVKKKSDIILSRDGWQIRIKLLSEQQTDIREKHLMFLFVFFSPSPSLKKILAMIRQVLQLALVRMDSSSD